MQQPTIDTIEHCVQSSHAGLISFGAMVQALAAADIESYHADYRGGTTTFYDANGNCHRTTLTKPPSATVAAMFDADALQRTIRGAQRGEVKYPEFVERSLQAGCIGYHVWIAGRHVVYLGRRGEQHVERFPG